jgi:vacuolar-type H+-ATPase subunit F/Vma7
LGLFVVLGEAARVTNFGLGGAVTLVAEDDDAVRAMWAALPNESAVVILTPRAAAALADAVGAVGGPLVAVMPTG